MSETSVEYNVKDFVKKTLKKDKPKPPNHKSVLILEFSKSVH